MWRGRSDRGAAIACREFPRSWFSRMARWWSRSSARCRRIRLPRRWRGIWVDAGPAAFGLASLTAFVIGTLLFGPPFLPVAREQGGPLFVYFQRDANLP